MTTRAPQEVDLKVPRGWTLVERRDDGIACQRQTLCVIASIAVEEDGRRWLHVSASRPSSLPSHMDLRDVRDAFVGKDRYAYTVFPPEDRYVNLHRNVLHLWACLDEDQGQVLPEFSGLVDGVRTI